MKNINEEKKIACFLVTGILIIMLCSLVSAFGVGSPYSPNTPLRMYPGEEKEVFLNLFNFDSDNEITVEGEILEGSEVVSLEGDIYKVPSRDSKFYVKMIVKIPESSSIGQKYVIVQEFKQVAPVGEVDGTGAAFKQGYKSSFDIEVIEKPAGTETPLTLSTTWIIVGIVVVILVIIVVWFIKKNKSSGSVK